MLLKRNILMSAYFYISLYLPCVEQIIFFYLLLVGMKLFTQFGQHGHCTIFCSMLAANAYHICSTHTHTHTHNQKQTKNTVIKFKFTLTLNNEFMIFLKKCDKRTNLESAEKKNRDSLKTIIQPTPSVGWMWKITKLTLVKAKCLSNYTAFNTFHWFLATRS